MKNKEFAILGMGEFGRSVAVNLAKSGASVLAVDRSEECLQLVADEVTHAVKADLTDPEALHALGVHNMDGVIVCIGDNMEASILSTIISKESGVPFVMAKAQSDIHASVLKKIGADQVIFPEKAMGARIARNLISGNFVDIIELSSTFSMAEISVPRPWVGQTLRQLDLRAMGLNMIAKKEADDISMVLNPDQQLRAGDVYILIGSNEALERIPKE